MVQQAVRVRERCGIATKSDHKGEALDDRIAGQQPTKGVRNGRSYMMAL